MGVPGRPWDQVRALEIGCDTGSPTFRCQIMLPSESVERVHIVRFGDRDGSWVVSQAILDVRGWA